MSATITFVLFTVETCLLPLITFVLFTVKTCLLPLPLCYSLWKHVCYH
jgi:hypothetical protein